MSGAAPTLNPAAHPPAIGGDNRTENGENGDSAVGSGTKPDPKPEFNQNYTGWAV